MPEAVTVEAVEAAVVADSEAALSAVAVEVDTVEAVEVAAATEATAVEMVDLEEAVEADSVVETAGAAAAEAVDVAATTATISSRPFSRPPLKTPFLPSVTRSGKVREIKVRSTEAAAAASFPILEQHH